MPFKVDRISAPKVPKTTPIIRTQRSSCVVQIYRYKDLNITKLSEINATKDSTLSGNSSAKGNLGTRPVTTIINDVVKCSISKNKDNKGTFSLILKKGKQRTGSLSSDKNIDYVQAVHPGDWIMIYIKKSGDLAASNAFGTKASSGLKFLGVVENVRYLEVDDPGRGTPRLDYQITGREFGKVLDMSLFFSPLINQEAIETILGVKFLSDSSKTIKVSGNSPDVVIKNLVDFYLGGKIQSTNSQNESWYIPSELAKKFLAKGKIKAKGNSFIDILDTTRIGMHQYKNYKFQKAVKMPGAALIKSLPSSGSVWPILQFMQNSVINEMYTELVQDSVGNLKPALIMRQVPFSNKLGHETNIFTAHKLSGGGAIADSVPNSDKTFFVDLPRLSIVSSDIKQKNIGKTDHERLNYALVVPKIDSDTYNVLYVAGANVPSIQRYGLKVFQGQTSYVLSASSTKQGDGIRDFCKRCVNLIQDWFFNAHNLYNGTIVIDGKDEYIEAGSNLYISDAQQLFHIEGYTHNYEIAASGETTYVTELRVSRGQLFDGKAAKFIGISKTVNDPTTVTVSFHDNARRSS